MWYLAVLGLLIFVGTCDGIVGGTNATATQFPFMAAVLGPQRMCGGSIIAYNWVLTSADCVYSVSVNFVSCYVGSLMYYKGGKSISASKIVTHPSYSTNNPYLYNLGLVQL